MTKRFRRAYRFVQLKLLDHRLRALAKAYNRLYADAGRPERMILEVDDLTGRVRSMQLTPLKHDYSVEEEADEGF